jgi:squalene-hopene/tetraprenyl-beta-curcumene cyclase
MKSRVAVGYVLLGVVVCGLAMWRASSVRSATAASKDEGWDAKAAARYLDDREIWWQTWPRAQKDHGTVCISCHTQVPYAMVRPALMRELGESSMGPAETAMMASVEKRVNGWNEMATFYNDAKSGPGKTAESRATEAVLNAVILASVDAADGKLRPVTRMAFAEAWALQETSGKIAGAWKWQNFHLGPWEGDESEYQGAALLMGAAVNAPQGYAQEPPARPHLAALQQYLRRGYASQPVINQVYVLWASAKVHDLLTTVQRTALLAKLHELQQTDGGWRTAAMDARERVDHTPQPIESDGYATGLAVLALEDSGASPRDPALERGRKWLEQHQDKDGAWYAASINKQRDPASDAGPFMRDAATAYAVKALYEKK